MRSQVLQVPKRWFFPIEKANLGKVLPVSSVCPGIMTALVFFFWSFSVWSLLNGVGYKKGTRGLI